jgi:hypothetical protein
MPFSSKIQALAKDFRCAKDSFLISLRENKQNYDEQFCWSTDNG